jgi:hypothetical protein
MIVCFHFPAFVFLFLIYIHIERHFLSTTLLYFFGNQSIHEDVTCHEHVIEYIDWYSSTTGSSDYYYKFMMLITHLWVC